MWLFPTCLLLVGKQQVDLRFLSPLNYFLKGCNLSEQTISSDTAVFCCPCASALKMHRKSVPVNLKIWRQLFIIDVSDGNNSIALSVAMCTPLVAGGCIGFDSRRLLLSK